MNEDRREVIKFSLMIGAPIILIIGSLLPSSFIIPLALTFFFGTFMGAYMLGDITQDQEKYKYKVIVICSIIILSSWLGIIYEPL